MFFLQVPGIDTEKIAEADSAVKAKLGSQLETLLDKSPNEIISLITKWVIEIGLKIVAAIIIWYLGRWVIRKIKKVLNNIFEKRDVDMSLRVFLQSLISITLTIILIIITIDILGLSTTSFLALFASAGLAIGVALSGTLQNFAGGVMLLLLKPYRIGDFIEAQGQSGTVKSIQLFNTIITTPDNKTIIIPNGPISTGIVNNYSTQSTRRVEWIIGINYGDDFEKAREVINSILEKDERIIHKKGYTIEIKELGNSAVNILVRVWTKSSDYWAVYFDINAKIYKLFPENGIEFPYDKLDVQLINK